MTSAGVLAFWFWQPGSERRLHKMCGTTLADCRWAAKQFGVGKLPIMRLSGSYDITERIWR